MNPVNKERAFKDEGCFNTALKPMPIKTLAILSVLGSTAFPVSLLAVHSFQEGQIPLCSHEMPTATPVCSEETTGIKYTGDDYRKIYG